MIRDLGDIMESFTKCILAGTEEVFILGHSRTMLSCGTMRCEVAPKDKKVKQDLLKNDLLAAVTAAMINDGWRVCQIWPDADVLYVNFNPDSPSGGVEINVDFVFDLERPNLSTVEFSFWEIL